MKQKSVRHKWADEGGREVVIGIMRMNDTPQWVIDEFCALGLREQFNKWEAIVRMVTHPQFNPYKVFPHNPIFSWNHLGRFTHF